VEDFIPERAFFAIEKPHPYFQYRNNLVKLQARFAFVK
jgi:hypothetical protein